MTTANPELESAYDFLLQENYESAFQEFHKLSKMYPDNGEVWISLGWLYQTGSGINLNIEKAIDCYQRAAKFGEDLGNYYLATIYKSERKLHEAVKYFSKSADKGHSSSAYWLGTMYLNGEGCEVSLKQAEKYLTLAMNSGHAFAKRDIALAKMKGTFGKREIFVGFFEYLKSVFQGSKLILKDVNNHDVR